MTILKTIIDPHELGCSLTNLPKLVHLKPLHSSSQPDQTLWYHHCRPQAGYPVWYSGIAYKNRNQLHPGIACQLPLYSQ